MAPNLTGCSNPFVNGSGWVSPRERKEGLVVKAYRSLLRSVPALPSTPHVIARPCALGPQLHNAHRFSSHIVCRACRLLGARTDSCHHGVQRIAQRAPAAARSSVRQTANRIGICTARSQSELPARGSGRPAWRTCPNAGSSTFRWG